MAIECSYYLEPVDTTDLPRRFLEAFAAILAHSNYALVLDAACRVSTRCGRCALTCPVYQASGDAAGHPVQALRAAAQGLPALLHARRQRCGARLGDAFDARRGPHQHDGRGVLPLHRLPALQARVPDGHRPRPASPTSAAGSWPRSGSSPRRCVVATREQLEGQDPQHLRDPRRPLRRHLRVPRGGLRRHLRAEDRVPDRRGGRRVRLLPGGQRLPARARHADGQRRRDDRDRRLVDHRHRRTSTASTTASSTPTGCSTGSSRMEAEEVRRLRREEDPDRRVRPRLALRQVLRPDLLRRRRGARRSSTSWSTPSRRCEEGRLAAASRARSTSG